MKDAHINLHKSVALGEKSPKVHGRTYRFNQNKIKWFKPEDFIYYCQMIKWSSRFFNLRESVILYLWSYLFFHCQIYFSHKKVELEIENRFSYFPPHLSKMATKIKQSKKIWGSKHQLDSKSIKRRRFQEKQWKSLKCFHCRF